MGALAGSQMGKITDGHYLTLPFSLLMLVVAGLTLKRNHLAGTPCHPHAAVHPAIVWPSVLALGGLAGFLGIGGGFLVVPALVWFSAFRWLKQWQPHWWSWRPWGYRPAPATPCPERYRSRLRAGSSSAAFWGRGGGGARRASEKREDIINVLYAVMLLALALYMLFKSL